MSHTDDFIELYKRKQRRSQKKLAKNIASVQQYPLNLPLNNQYLFTLSRFLKAIYPDITDEDVKHGEFDYIRHFYFSTSCKDVDTKMCERMLTNLFVKSVALYGIPSRYYEKTRYFFRLQEDEPFRNSVPKREVYITPLCRPKKKRKVTKE